MSALSIQPTYPIFTDADGQPLEDGYIWIGTANLDPQGNPINVYWDAALTQLAGQPIRTLNGYPANSGTPARLYVNSDYSIRVMNKNGSTVYSAPEALERYNGEVVSYSPGATSLLTANNVQDALDQLSDESSGSSFVGFLQSGTNATPRSVQSKLREFVSVLDFGADPTGAADSTNAIQDAINYAATLGPTSVGNVVYMPPGQYKTTSTITTGVVSPVGQVALVGAGLYATIIKPDGDFTVLSVVTSYAETGGFTIEWPVTAAASIPATRIGVELAGADWQFSYATLKNVTVSYGYRGFILRDWTGQPLGTAFLCTLQQLTAFRCADWGFYLDSKTGSTTLRMIHCYARGDNSSGGAQYGKGVYINNFNDIYTEQLGIDQCLNSWIQFVNYNVCVMNGTSLEANKMSSAAAVAVNLNGVQTIIDGFKDIANTFDTSGNARVIFAGVTATLALCGYNEQFSTVAGGTTKYLIAFNAAATQISINDRTVLPTQVLDNGYYANAVYEGNRLSSVGNAPNYGTWVRGDNVLNGVPAVGQPKGWVCTVAGTPGTWVSEGNL